MGFSPSTQVIRDQIPAVPNNIIETILKEDLLVSLARAALRQTWGCGFDSGFRSSYFIWNHTQREFSLKQTVTENGSVNFEKVLVFYWLE